MFVYWIHLPEQIDIALDGYVGVATDFKQRMFAHKSCAKTGKEQTLYKAIRKYGWDNLIKEVILISNEKYCLEIEKKLRPSERIGWNISAGGAEIVGFNLKGIKQSESHLINRKKALIGRVSGMKGKKQSKEAIEKTMAFVRGIPKTKECKIKLAESKKKPIQINGTVYDSWLDANQKTGIPTGSFSYLLAGKFGKKSKYSWINSISLVM